MFNLFLILSTTMKLKKEQLVGLSLEELLEMLNPDFHLNQTFFEQSHKKWQIAHNYYLIGEVNSDSDDVDEWETFGYPLECINYAKTKEIFGSTPKEALINFFVAYPWFVINPKHITKNG